MAVSRFAVPNWAQRLIADAAGLQGRAIAVRHEDDRSILFLDHKTRDEYFVTKENGKVSIWKNPAFTETKKGGAPTDQSQGTAI